MKLNPIRLGILCVFVICFCSPVFPQGAEAARSTHTEDAAGIASDSPVKTVVMPWHEAGTAFGLEFGNFWGSSADDVKIHTSSVAYHIHHYTIRNDGKFGMSFRLSLGLPNVETINGSSPKYIDYDAWQTGLTGEFLYNHILHKKLSLFYGIGAHFVYTRERYSQYMPLTAIEENYTKKNLKAGSNAGITVRYLNGNILVLAGCAFDYDMPTVMKSSNEADALSGFGVRPFFSIGHTL